MREAVLHFARALTFRVRSEDVADYGWWHFAIGLALTVLAGVGRWWDDPSAVVPQRIGLASLIYVFMLSLWLWAFAAPLANGAVHLGQIVVYVMMTSPVALLYALPVERWNTPQEAALLNVQLLGLVATWRIAMYLLFLKRAAQLTWFRTLSAAMLPIALVICALNLARISDEVARGMGGVRESTIPQPAEQALDLVFTTAWLVFPVALVCWLWAVISEMRGVSDLGSPE